MFRFGGVEGMMCYYVFWSEGEYYGNFWLF